MKWPVQALIFSLLLNLPPLAYAAGKFAISGANAKKPALMPGVTWQADSTTSNASPADTAALVAAISALWDNYLRVDQAAYTALLAPDVTRMSQRAGGLQQGREAVAAGLPAEWEAFERSQGRIAEKLTINHAELKFEADASAATAIYWVDVSGGGLWSYQDQGVVLQSFARQPGQPSWLLTHQTDAWTLDYDAASAEPGETSFTFDYVYPVTNLARAVAFYTPLLGAPEAQTAQTATFNFKGSRFVLDTSKLDGHVQLKPGLPNGYAVFYVADVVAERDRLMEQDVSFLSGTDERVKKRGADAYVIGQDAAGNVFVLQQKNFSAAAANAPAAPSGFDLNDPYQAAARNIAAAWLKMDAPGLSRYYGAAGRWFDDTRVKTQGLERGAKAIAAALPEVYWPRYDHSAAGLLADLAASSVYRRAVGSRTLISYAMDLSGNGSHPFQDRALVTHLFENETQAAATFIVAAPRPVGLVLDLDYTGYPVPDLAEAERFYSRLMKLGKPYTDEDWRGYWSDRAVFGIYTADPDEDGLPRPKRANGYMSFWVHSAQKTYAYLQQQGVSFPVIPAINSVQGVDTEPGYAQTVATDSEGNLVIFTEYTGRRK